VSPGEACDDGNTTDGDGCSSTCAGETSPVAETCAALVSGDAITVSVGSVTLPAANPLFSNAGASDDYQGSCAWESGGLDQVFEIVPDTNGTLTATVGLDLLGAAFCQPPNYDAAGCVDHTLFVREADCAATTDLACQESNPVDLTNVLAFPVTAGTHYFVFVDGYNGEWYSSGAYTLNLVLQ
jgi:cysteine-rich repeat protein